MERLDTNEAAWKHIVKLSGEDGGVFSVWVWQAEDDAGGVELDFVELHMCDSDGRALLTAKYQRSPRVLRRQQGDSTSRIYDYQLSLNDEEYLFGHPQKANFGRVAIDHHFQTRQHSRGLWIMSEDGGSRARALYEQLGFEQTDSGEDLRQQELYFALPRTTHSPRHELPA